MIANISSDTEFSCSEQILSSDIGDEYVMMSIDEGNYYSLKGPSGRVWELIQGGNNVTSMVAALTREYHVQPLQCEEELLSLLDDMLDGKLIQIKNG